MNLEEMGRTVRSAARQLAKASTQEKNQALLQMADALWKKRDEILTANALDLKQGETSGLNPAMLERLMLNETRLQGIVNDLRSLAELQDPVGEIFDAAVLPNGLKVHRQRVPIGVLAVIYESRPNVTIDVVGLSVKSGNGVILRGGSESIHSNRALIDAVRVGFKGSALPIEAVQFIDDTDRSLVLKLMKMYNVVDMLIPRGGAALHKFCRENSLVPVITGGIGICHLFVDETADIEASLPLIRNAKVQRPTVCNALDTVLVHRSVAGSFIPRLVQYLAADGVTFRADPAAYNILSNHDLNMVKPAGPDDFDTEWLSLVLGIRVVDNLDQAIDHIAAHSTAHSDGILTRIDGNARQFIAEVDSAAVYVNASTRFTDGSQLGLGAEIAVSTQRLHARGPMALRELTTYKWVISGDYHVRP